MTAPRVTSCPHCKTSFRITQAQLRAANGSVRCGSCLQVFDAKSGFDNKTSSKQGQKPAVALAQESSDSVKDAEKLVVPTASLQTASETDSKLEETSTKPETSPEPEPSFSKTIRELDEKEDRTRQLIHKQRQTHYLWVACAAFFTLTLVFQYAWFNKNTLSLKPVLRPAYEWFCNAAGCTLPPQVDIASIKSLQLMVRSHPNEDEALIVDAVIINDASHLQPYPVLDLSFTDINGNLLASREFSPREYLAGELAGSKDMPVGQPIRLGLEIIDPGEEAVNYALSFLKSTH